MKKALRRLATAVGALLALAAVAAGYVASAPIPRYPVVTVDFPVDVTADRVARGRRSVEMLCSACHMDSATGSLTGRRMPDLPAQFGEAWSRNITAHPVKGIGSWTNGEIAYLLRTGVARDGRYTPPWMVKMPNASDEDLRDIIAFLRSDDPVVQARDVDDLAGGNAMPDLGGKLVYTANLTPDPETGLGRWTAEEFRRALKEGIRPDNRPLRYPMVPYRPLSDAEVDAIFAYLRSVPPVRNEVRPPETYEVTGEQGKQVYYAYGCNGCHGDTGHGQYDLRKGAAKYPTDDELIAWIKHPERVRPGIAMPTWDGVIREEEYAPLAAYVRSLAKAPAGSS